MAPIPKILRCTTCSQEFPNEGELTEHTSSSRSRCPCSECIFAKWFCFTNDDLYLHMEIYHEHMVCTFCRKTFETPADKRRHDLTGSFKCATCPHIDFCCREAVEAHHRGSWHHATTLCKDCCTNYDSFEELLRHQCHPVDRRTEIPRYECGICGLRDLTAYGLGAHRYWNHGWSYRDNERTPPTAKAPPKTPPKASTKPPPKASPKPPPKPPINPETSPAAMDLYAVLGVNPSSSPQDIEKAAKKRRIDCHPDKLKRMDMSNPELQAIDDWAKEVGGAAEVLLDPRKRVRYDWQRRNGLNGSKV